MTIKNGDRRIGTKIPHTSTYHLNKLTKFLSMNIHNMQFPYSLSDCTSGISVVHATRSLKYN